MKSTTHLKKEISIPAVSRKWGDSFQGTSEFQPTAFPIFTLDIKSQILFRGSHFSTGGGGQREVWAGPKASWQSLEMHRPTQKVYPATALSPSLGRVGGSLLAYPVQMRTPAETLTPAAMGQMEIEDSPVQLTHTCCTFQHHASNQDMPLNSSL